LTNSSYSSLIPVRLVGFGLRPYYPGLGLFLVAWFYLFFPNWLVKLFGLSSVPGLLGLFDFPLVGIQRSLSGKFNAKIFFPLGNGPSLNSEFPFTLVLKGVSSLTYFGILPLGL